MALSPFLENLKKSVDTGEFNSDAAKKIIELDKLANTAGTQAIETAIEKGGIKTVSEGEAAEINSDYEKKMQLIKEKDLALQQLAMLREIEETVRLSVYDLRDFLKTLEQTFDRNKVVNGELFNEIDQIKNKYNSIINN